MSEVGRLLAGTSQTAAVLDPLRARLQTTLAALAAFLSQHELIRVRVAD
jgi:hypothetical protein